MKTITEVEDAVVSTNLKTRDIGFEVNPTSVGHMLDSLYSDIVGTILRELTTNAIESHMVAGTDKKVAIQLPTSLDQNLYFRDFGTGLNEEETIKYLGTLFSSNKNQNNDLPGGYGLGAKSPLALVDSFIIEVVKEGIKNTYTWVKERGKLPRFINVAENEKTTEPNGVFYNIPLENNPKISGYRIKELFAEKANKQLLGFKDQIMFVDNILEKEYSKLIDVSDSVWTHNIIFDSDKLMISSEKNSSYSYGNKFFVSIGNVVYPYPSLNYEAIGFLEKYLEENNTYHYYLKIPIGKLDIPMSREEVIEHAQNTEIIKDCLEELVPFFKEYTTKVLNIETDCDYKTFYSQQVNMSLSNTSVKGNLPLLLNYSIDSLFKHEPALSKLLKDFNIDSSNFSRHFLPRLRPTDFLSSTNIFGNSFRYVEPDTRRSTYYSSCTHKYFIIPSPSPATYTLLNAYVEETYGLDENSFTYLSVKDEYKEAIERLIEVQQTYEELRKVTSTEIIGTYSEQDINNFKSSFSTGSSHSLLRSSLDYIPGSFLLKSLATHFQPYSSNPSFTLNKNHISIDSVRINHLVDASKNDAKIPLGIEYLDSDVKARDIILVINNAKDMSIDLPIKYKGNIQNIILDAVKERTKDIAVIGVPERSFNSTKTRLEKQGINVYCSENILEIEEYSFKDLTPKELSLYFRNKNINIFGMTQEVSGLRYIGRSLREYLDNCLEAFKEINSGNEQFDSLYAALTDQDYRNNYVAYCVFDEQETEVSDNFWKEFQDFCDEYLSKILKTDEGIEFFFNLVRGGHLDSQQFKNFLKETYEH